MRADSALELQLSLPTSYRTTAFRGLALTLAWTALLALVAGSWLALSGRLIWPVSFAADQLIWLAPLLWLAAAGATITLGLRAFVIGIAQALLNDPQFLIVDEPTAGLDPSDRATAQPVVRLTCRVSDQGGSSSGLRSPAMTARNADQVGRLVALRVTAALE